MSKSRYIAIVGVVCFQKRSLITSVFQNLGEPHCLLSNLDLLVRKSLFVARLYVLLSIQNA